MIRVLALTKYGDVAASTRQRFLQYAPMLKTAGIKLETAALLGNDHLRRLVEGRRASPSAVARAYARRLADIAAAGRFDLLWVHCESFPYLPGLLERLVFVHGRPVVYDYDDAIHHMYDASGSAVVRRLLGSKLQPLMRGAAACTCGNAYLAEYAGRFCERTLVVPTVVDTERYLPVRQRSEAPLTIGWIGSPSTWPEVRPLLPLLDRLCRERGVRFRVVGAGNKAAADHFDGMDLIPWSEEREIADVQAMDIGIMPLADAPFQRGKSGYKLIQYMACALPVVASPVGVNATIVEPDRNGFLASATSEWEAALTALLDDPALRRRLGGAGREKAVERYSLASQAPRLVELFRSLAPRAG